MNWVRRLFYRILVTSRRVAAIGYLLSGVRFDRELHSIAAGRYANLVRRAEAPSDYRLRRGIHRLEKGLVMYPRASIFAVDYIDEVVELFVQASARTTYDPAELKWARDVLSCYFAVVDDHPSLRKARATCGGLLVPPNEASSAPYQREIAGAASVDFRRFYDLCRFRVSTRRFETRPVDRSLVEQALSAAACAPSACNRQPYFYQFFLSPPEAAAVAGLAVGTSGYSEQIPALAVVLGDFSAIEGERDRHIPYIDASLSAMQFMLALETLGLCSSAINWPDIEEREAAMGARLALPAHVRPVMLIAFGYPHPEAAVPFSAKKPLSLLWRDNTTQ